MTSLARIAMCAVLTINLASTSFGEEQRSQKIEIDQVPAAVMKTANEAELKVEWSEALRKESGTGDSKSRCYVLKGQIVILPQRQLVLFDGDVEIFPGKYQPVEVGIYEDGKLIYVAKSLPVENVPWHVMSALKKTIDLEPSQAWTIRFTAKGQTGGYLFWLDSFGGLQYTVTADGKRVSRI